MTEEDLRRMVDEWYATHPAPPLSEKQKRIILANFGPLKPRKSTS